MPGLLSSYGRSYPAGHFELQIGDMTSTAYVKSYDGGWPKMNTSDEPLGGEIEHVKHGTSINVDPLQLEIGMSQTDYLLYWIAKSWRRQYARENGAIVHADFDYKTTFTHHFMGALIEETTFPTLDASSRDVAYLKVKIRPEEVTFEKGDGNTIAGKFKGKQKLWPASAFRFTLEGIPQEQLDRVNKIESFSITQKIKEVASGAFRLPQIEPTSITFPDLNVQISMAHADGIFDWYQQVVLRGEKDGKAEREGAIEFLSTDRKKVNLRIELKGVGIKGFNLPRGDANQDAIKRATFQLYVTRMDISGDDRYALE